MFMDGPTATAVPGVQAGSVERYRKPTSRETQLKWARIWVAQLDLFHRRKPDQQRTFSADDVIAFLRQKRDAGVPAWKRMKVIEGLITFRRSVQDRPHDDLAKLRETMQGVIDAENQRKRGPEIEEARRSIDPNEPDVLREFRVAMRRTGLALKTERSYVQKVRTFMNRRGLKCLKDFEAVTSADVEAHLSDLAVDGNVAASTQNAAFHALLKLFQLVLKREMGEIDAIRASNRKPIPTVLSKTEVAQVLDHLRGTHRTIAELLYGCGLRISEAMRLRVKDIDFDNGWIQVHRAKGNKNRLVPLPQSLREELRHQIDRRRGQYEDDVRAGTASVWLPEALEKKSPQAAGEFRWQYVFASEKLSRDPRSGRFHRHHLHMETFGRHLPRAVRAAETREVGDQSYVSSLFCNASFASGDGHSQHPGVVGARGRIDDDDLHARVDRATGIGAESVGWVVSR